MKMNPVVHFEMPAADSKRMADFYARAFGWQTKQMGPEMGNYVVVTTTELSANQLPKEPAESMALFHEDEGEPTPVGGHRGRRHQEGDESSGRSGR